MEFVLRAILIGVGATLLLDAWSLLQSALFRAPPPNMAMLGRWAGHLFRGRFAHASIAKAEPIEGERLVGWAAHYAIGVMFAAALVALCGLGWAREPTLLPALVFGIVTVAAPYLLLQPATGLGFAASRAPNPNAARLKSLVSHTVFGVALYLAALVVALLIA
jgi:hypothetical protein